MAEQSVQELAYALQHGKPVEDIRGLSYISRDVPPDYQVLPAYEEVVTDKSKFISMFHSFYRNNDPITASGLVQKHADRWLIQNPPPPYATQAQMDAVYALPFQRAQHPFYEKQGPVKALETIGFSVSTHRGCYGECNFCAIAVHEGRTVRWRSPESIVAEVEAMTNLPGFKGIINDVGGPTANMYGFECRKKLKNGVCEDKRCIYPEVCSALKPTHQPQVELLRRLRRISGIRKVFVASGIRYDLIAEDTDHGQKYMNELVSEHVSGQLKIAPEHTEEKVLEFMGKPGTASLLRFKQNFDDLSARAGKKQFLTYYMIAAHPGCSDRDMQRLKEFAGRQLHLSPEQVQIFTPSPSTYSSLMYYTEMDPFTLKPLFVEKDLIKRDRQKRILVEKPQDPGSRRSRFPDHPKRRS
jgi:uncharacterized radical SAM protein YgiQ